MGDAVNLAARLMCKAEVDSVLADEPTAMACMASPKSKGDYIFEALPPMTLRGKKVVVNPFVARISPTKGANPATPAVNQKLSAAARAKAAAKV